MSVPARKHRGEALMVDKAEFSSYYGRPIIKEPVWKAPDVPAYLFLGGLAGASSTMAALADVTGDSRLRRVGRLAAAAGAAVSVGALVHDLGRPTRFLYMLRVFKPTSPLSVGSWILAPFSGLAAGTAALELSGRWPLLGRLGGVGAGVLGPAMTTYTSVLLADTAVPAWHDAYRELPFVFAGSALASSGAVGLIAAAPAAAGPTRRMAVLGACLELAASARMTPRLGMVGEVYQQGRAGTMLRAARGATAAGAITAVVGRRSRRLSAVAGGLLLAGGAATRYGIFEAGLASARDPRYTVVPQRERLASTADRHAPVEWPSA